MSKNFVDIIADSSRVGDVIPIQFFALMRDSGYFSARTPFIDGQFQPASIDLRLADKVWRVKASAVAGSNSTVAEMLDSTKLHEINIEKGAVLEVGCVYVAPLQESLALPREIYGKCNPKSSSGRLDIFVRLLCDYNPVFDNVPPGYHGRLYVEISPQSFPILVRSGSRLAQMRFKTCSANKNDSPANIKEHAHKIIDIDVNLQSNRFFTNNGNSLFGYRARNYSGVIDIDKTSLLDRGDFWEQIDINSIRNNYLVLEPGAFYILVSNKKVRVDLSEAAEMKAFDPAIGEFRVHYAGFFDPGFGLGGDGSYAVLEVRSRDVPFLLRHGQTIGKLHYERLLENCSEGYGFSYGSHYQNQRLKLSKHFK